MLRSRPTPSPPSHAMSHKPDCRCAHQTLDTLIAGAFISYLLIGTAALLIASR